MSELERYGTALMRSLADTVAANITTGHDWPNSQDELTRLQSGRLLREAADAIDSLRGQRDVMVEVLRECHAVIETLEPESTDEDAALWQLLRSIKRITLISDDTERKLSMFAANNGANADTALQDVTAREERITPDPSTGAQP